MASIDLKYMEPVSNPNQVGWAGVLFTAEKRWLRPARKAAHKIYGQGSMDQLEQLRQHMAADGDVLKAVILVVNAGKQQHIDIRIGDWT